MIWIRTARPAKAGDKLVSTSFPDTPTRGFASADDRSVAVCLLPGTELSFEKEIRCDGLIFSWRPGHKVAKFQQVNKDKRHVHHDALEFPDGKIVLLTQLSENHATVLQLPARLHVTADDTEREDAARRGVRLCLAALLMSYCSLGGVLVRA
jgi:hypothetical protein